jgi:hypothetical protein
MPLPQLLLLLSPSIIRRRILKQRSNVHLYNLKLTSSKGAQ